MRKEVPDNFADFKWRALKFISGNIYTFRDDDGTEQVMTRPKEQSGKMVNNVPVRIENDSTVTVQDYPACIIAKFIADGRLVKDIEVVKEEVETYSDAADAGSVGDDETDTGAPDAVSSDVPTSLKNSEVNSETIAGEGSADEEMFG